MTSESHYITHRHEFSHSEVTWAGEGPFAGGLCFGFEDGSLIFNDPITGAQKPPQIVNPSGEPINGLTFIDRANFAVSTRADVAFFRIDEQGGMSRVVYPGGAHGIRPMPSGYFVAPLNVNGLLIMKPDDKAEQRINVSRTGGSLCLARLDALCGNDGSESLIVACRRDGIGISHFAGYSESREIHTNTCAGVDIIDVCRIPTGLMSAAAVASNGLLVYYDDVRTQHPSASFGLGQMRGRILRMLASRGHLFILTTNALYVWRGLAEQMHGGELGQGAIGPIEVPMQAIDFSIVDNSTLFVVLAENVVLSLDIARFDEERNHTDLRYPIVLSDLTWSQGIVHTVQTDFLLAG